MVCEHLRDQMHSRVTIWSIEIFYYRHRKAEREQMVMDDNIRHDFEKLVTTLLFTPLVCRGYLLPHTCSARPGFFNRRKATRAITNDRATPIANVICGVTSTTPARSTTCAPCTSKTISDGIIRGEPSSFIFLDRSLKGEQFGKLAVFHLGKPGVEVLRSRVCTATGQIAAPGHRPDRLLVGLCIVESSR